MNRKKGLLLLAAVIGILCLVVVIYTGKDKNKDNNNSATEVQNEAKKNGDAIVIEEGKSLIIPVSEVATEASFIKVELDSVQMEIIAVRGSDNYVRTAFNTCQVCYDSGRGYYVQEGDVFICQNCGNRFTVDDIEIKSGGCNPWPIFPEDKIVTDESIEITYDFLSESKNIFANWKKSY